ncbi:MAG: hypothetical protein WCL08_04530 [Verrucomicrobiota bacterium]
MKLNANRQYEEGQTVLKERALQAEDGKIMQNAGKISFILKDKLPAEEHYVRELLCKPLP